MFMFTVQDTAEIRLINKNAHIYSNLCEGLGLNGKNNIPERAVYKGVISL